MSDELASIVVPVYNDPEGVRETIESVLDRTTYPRFELLIVDNNSTDDTAAVVTSFADQHDEIAALKETAVQSSYAARNTGIEHASGDVICFLDADQTVTDGWLSTAVGYVTKHDAVYLAPDVRLSAPDDASFAARYNATTGFPIEEFLERQQYAPTACLFVQRRLMEDVGRFDERLVSGGDYEFGQRVHHAGYELHYCPDVVVYHPVRASVRALWSRNVRIGRGHCQLQRHYPDRYGRVGIPPRPSGITSDQYEGVRNRLTFGTLDLALTAARGLGYYREAIVTWLG